MSLLLTKSTDFNIVIEGTLGLDRCKVFRLLVYYISSVIIALAIGSLTDFESRVSRVGGRGNY